MGRLRLMDPQTKDTPFGPMSRIASDKAAIIDGETGQVYEINFDAIAATFVSPTSGHELAARTFSPDFNGAEGGDVQT